MTTKIIRMMKVSAGSFITVGVVCATCVVLFMNSLQNRATVKYKLQSVNRDEETQRGVDNGAISCQRQQKVHDYRQVVNATFDYKAAMQRLNAAKVSHDDPLLIQLIRNYYLVPPSREPYNLQYPDVMDPSIGQTPFVDSRLGFLECGFFVECGAHNGEWGSNTLFFERIRKWGGLLVEADPENFEKLKATNRKAYLLNACLNTEPHPAMKTFNMASNRGRIVNTTESNKWLKQQQLQTRKVQVQCFPLYSALLALGQTTVHYFSLDVEGDEVPVLKTIPWDKVDIKMLTAEFTHGSGGDATLRKYVSSQGYEPLLKVSRWDNRANDVIFRKKKLVL